MTKAAAARKLRAVPNTETDPAIAKAMEEAAAIENKKAAKVETDAEKIARLETENAQLRAGIDRLVARLQKGGAIIRRVLGEYDAAIGL